MELQDHAPFHTSIYLCTAQMCIVYGLTHSTCKRARTLTSYLVQFNL